MLRKILLLGLPLLLALATMMTVMLYERQRTPSWQQTLEQYFDQHLALADSDNVVASVEARLPWAFVAEMGRAVVDDEAWQWSIEQLPYPPDALYCVLVSDTPSAASQSTDAVAAQRLVYVAHHTDKLWRVGWVVHEGETAPFADKTMDDLATVGCELESLDGVAR